jgi:hypothetical protein
MPIASKYYFQIFLVDASSRVDIDKVIRLIYVVFLSYEKNS